jgi:TldD protein
MSSSHIEIAKKALLEPAGLSESDLFQVVDQMMAYSPDLADLFFQETQSESWTLDNQIVKGGSYSVHRGVGARCIFDEKTGFAYADDIQFSPLKTLASMAGSLGKKGGKQSVEAYVPVQGHHLYPPVNPLNSLSATDKVAFLKKIDRLARQKDPRVKEVIVSLHGSYEINYLIASDQTLAADVRPIIQLSIVVLVESKGRIEKGFFIGGERGDYHYFLDNHLYRNYVDEAVRQALVNLEAIDAPAGKMPVVLGAGWPGVLLHESVGHGLEGDNNRKQTSVFTNRIGEQVAASHCTIVDDGTLPHRRGSTNIDDEGTPTQHTVLIEKGILKGYMQDKLNARLMGTASTGNGRRESYAHIPIPRMTNTYLLPGKYLPEEIIASVKKGLYAVNFSGGQVDTTSGQFVFSASEAYLIENGKVTRPVKCATLIGSGTEVLKKVSMVGHDLNFDDGSGFCGKDGQSVPVGIGQPTLKVDELVVGGTVCGDT